MPMLIVSQEPSKQLASSVETGKDPVTVFLSFVPKGGQNEIVWIIGGASTISVCKGIFMCKACGKLGGSGGMLPQRNV